MWTAADYSRRRGRSRKNHRTPAGRPPRSPPISRLRLRRCRQPLRDDFSDFEGDESEHELDESDEGDGEHERRRVKKKLKLLLKLHRPPSPPQRKPSSASSVSFPDEVESGSDDGECCSRKRRRGGGGRDAGNREVERKQLLHNRKAFASESDTLLPDRKTLESILDKIQMKDKYGVFAEPVDLDELPDYLEIIEHPMDFGTIRKKLARKFYANLEEFEADVYLVCSNAMQYNAPETIYHKQARSMHEVAKKSFLSLRDESRACETLSKTELNGLPNSNRPKSSTFTPQEKAGSDTSSIAIVTTNENNGIQLKSTDVIRSEKPIKDSEVTVAEASSTIEKSEMSRIAEPNQSVNKEDLHQSGNNQEVIKSLEKVENVEEFSEKSPPPKGGLKLDSADESCHPVDENRRATYNISNQPTVCQFDSIFSIFEADKKELMTVGLDAEYAYARSLARFSATLGPIGWRIASEKIEKALPAGVRFGPGWVGEYEPLPTPVLSVVENIQLKGNKSSQVCEAPAREKIQHKHHSVDRDRKEPKEDKQNRPLNGKHNALASSFQMSISCTSSLPSFGGQAPKSTARKSTCKGEVGGKLGSFQFSPRPQPTIANDLVCPQIGKSVGVPWRDQTSENGRASVPKPESTVNSSVACNGSAGCVSMKPKILLETTTSRFVSPVGDTTQSDVDSRKGMWMTTNQTPMSMNMGFPTDRDARKSCQAPISMSAANSSYRDETSSGPVSCSGETRHNSHANKNATQVTKGPIKSVETMPGNMLLLQNYPSSMTNTSTRQFIPAPSPRYPLKSGSGPEVVSITNTDSSANIPMNSWISIGNYSECKSTETPDFFKVQAEPHVYKPSCITSAPGMYHVTNGRPQLLSFNPHTTNGRSLLPLASQMGAEKSDLQRTNLAYTPLFSSELTRPQHMFSWQEPMVNIQPRKSEDMLPPDLNIGFQSPGSPVKRSSGIRVDSQPDLALQL